MSAPESPKAANFLEQIIAADLESGKHGGRLQTRFPPEPNGYLHIGHAKSICLNFGLAQKFGGQCNLRFDDTNPGKEDQEYVDAIERDVRWLGFEWSGEVKYASSYFDTLYDWALHLIRAGKAYVCDLSPEEARAYRGTLTEPGQNSPYRERSVEENLALFEKMRAGEFDEGACVLRARIDMASPNINLRDPILYRIRKLSHHQTGDTWCIYPTYDFAHGQEDAIEGITHSICTLEFADHRPLYDWFIENLPVPHQPKQFEFARLELNYTVTSKRKLKQLVDEGHVDGWNDPRMPTISGLRRRGVPAAALRSFCDMIGVNKAGGVVDVAMLEHCIREELNRVAPRAMAVLNPVKVVLTNYPQGQVEELTLPVHPQDESQGVRTVPFSRELYIDRADFAEEAPRKWKRLAPDHAVRLRGGYVIQFEEAIKDAHGEIVELRCRYDANTLGVNPEGYKAKGVIHWVSAEQALDAEVRLYDRLFSAEKPDGDKEVSFLEHLNPESLVVVEQAKLEPALATAVAEQAYQFEREGYFCLDSEADGKLVFNRTITLRDTWAKLANQS